MSGRTQPSRVKTASRTGRDASPAVAFNVRRLRMRKGYTLDTLARACNVEPELLEQVERGKEAATITLLWSLSAALGVPFGALVSQPGTRHSESDLVSSEASPRSSGLVCRPVLPSAQGPRRTEVYQLTLAAHASRVAPPRPVGAVDNLLVTSGTVVIGFGKVRHLLKTGDSLDFRSDVQRTYSNPSDRETTMYVVITYAQSLG
ncbi:MAG: XRE family transcriptional regulator [Myxococcales bacterium]